MLRRLRTLSERECYARCYGSGDEAVRVVHRERRRVVARDVHVSGERLRQLFEERLDSREPRAA
ncbi:MAG: hypothetical protein LC685_04285 [Actinobacteria bacterium]|nr:hypothetical protein [Actinomycetota bacterium]